MLDTIAVADLIKPILAQAIAPIQLTDVRVAETADSEGQEALEVLAVADRVSGDTVDARIDASVAVQQLLRHAGETRYAFVRFTTLEAIEENEADEAADA